MKQKEIIKFTKEYFGVRTWVALLMLPFYWIGHIFCKAVFSDE